mgnify:FL=1|jgi:hypothetical protein
MTKMLTVLLEETPFCTILARKVEAYFQDEENRKRFEEWYKKKYGKDYEWR